MDFDFIHLSDLHISAPPELLISMGLRTQAFYDMWSMDRRKRDMDMCVEMINASKASFVILSGDLTETGSEACYNAYLEVQKRFTLPIYPVPGNHDVGNVGTWPGLQGSFRNYERFVGRPYYSFDDHDCHFIGLCSSLVTGSVADIEHLDQRRKEQEGWFLKDLAAASNAGYFRIFVFMEYPPQGGDKVRCTQDLYDLLPVFEKYGVTAVFSGHMHDNIEENYKDVRLITTTTMTDYYHNPEGPGFRLVHVSRDTFSSEFIPIENELDKESS